MDTTSLTTLFLILVVFIILSAFFSISETSMMAINRYRLKHLAQTGHRGAKLTSLLLQKVDRLLSVILLGSSLVNAAAASLVTVITIRLFGNHEWAITMGALVLTFLLLIFSEITPKIMGASYPEKIAFPASFVLSPLLQVEKPIIWFVNLFVQSLLWLMRFKTVSGAQHKLSMEELRMLVLEESHFIPKGHQSILLNIFDLEAITVDDVMIPRSQIEAIDITIPPETMREQLSTAYHARVLAYKENLDNVVGILDVRKALAKLESEPISAENLSQILKEPYFVPEGTPLFSQLQHFKENRRRLGLVVDEYGELRGLVALEDIIEEILGEFNAHSPMQTGMYQKLEDGSYLVEGSSLLRELNRKLGLALPLDGPKTLNGLILEHFEDIPESGTSLKIADYPVEIVQTHGRFVKMARIFPKLSTR
ncbi:MAG TPA: HlyC/CorC family transporter [Burkholderiales bacterium]|nr:HlyC/CorC family transporter [Burkholderiales bacterium]